MPAPVPVPLDEATRSKMQRQRLTRTKPEVALRQELHRRGLRFRTQLRLAARTTPDIVFTRARLAVWVDGCFWHRCPEHATRPKNNAEWWDVKLTANEERDRRQTRQLEADGWKVIRTWEHENVTDAADRVECAYRTLMAGHG